MTKEHFYTILQQCLLEYNGNQRFFDHFYKEEGTALFFLFKKSMAVSNLQYGELVALLRRHVTNDIQGTTGRTDYIFTSVAQFNRALRENFNTFLRSYHASQEPAAIIEMFVTIFYDNFRRTIVIDSLYTSAAVFLPPGCSCDLELICAESGYIHSCGHNVFLRNVDKAQEDEFYQALDAFLERESDKRSRLRFIVYAHEDFSGYDNGSDYMIKDGINGTKIHVEKFFLGRTSLTRLVSEIKRRYEHEKQRLVVPSSRDYRKDDSESYGVLISHGRALWLIVDRSVNLANSRSPGSDTYYICYEQLYKNADYLHHFDEDKLAWKSSSTIPHTMAAAMINIAMDSLGKSTTGEPIRFCDPFVGSGTLVLEASKFPSVSSYARDIDNGACFLMKHNKFFFTRSAAELSSLVSWCRTEVVEPARILAEAMEQNKQIFGGGIKAKVVNLQKQLSAVERHIRIEEEELALTDEQWVDLDMLIGSNLHLMFLFYMRVRAKLRNFRRGQRVDDGLKEARDYEFTRIEVTTYLKRLTHLIGIYERIENSGTPRNSPYYVYRGKYSVSISRGSSFWEQRYTFTCGPQGDVSQLGSQVLDIIVCDPPYGFNIGHNAEVLAKFYQQWIRSCVQALRPGGVLVFALAERSFSGRISPYFTHKEMVTQELIGTCAALNRSVIIPGDILPHANLYRPPFYWVADKALARSVMVFKIQ